MTDRELAPADTVMERGNLPRELRLHFACAACETWLSVPLRSAGTEDFCPGCGGSVKIPELDGQVIGLDLARGEAAPAHAPAAAELPPPPDEFDLAVIEFRAFQAEIDRRSRLIRTVSSREADPSARAREAFESTDQYVDRLLAALPGSAERRRDWVISQLNPLFERLARLGGHTFRTHDVEVELGPYHADGGYFPVRILSQELGGAGVLRRQLRASPELARGLYSGWGSIRKLGSVSLGLGGRRILRTLSLAGDTSAERFELRFDEIFREGPGPVTAVAFSADGRHLAIGTSEAVEVHDLLRATARSIRGTPGNTLSFHPDGNLLAIASVTCTLWDVDQGRGAGRIGAVSHAEFSPDGRWLLTGSRSGVSLVSVSELDVTRLLHDPIGEPVAWCPDGRFFAVKNRVYEVPSCRLAATVPVSRLAALRFSRDGGLLAVASQDGEAMLFRMPSLTLIARLPHALPVRALSFSPDGSLLVTGQGTASEAGMPTPMSVWDTRSGTLVKRTGHPGPVTALDFSPDGANLVVGAWSGRVRSLKTASLPDVISD